MSTLIAVYNSDGCVGKCDANCYNATSPVGSCECICGGRNHGAGEKRAIENTRQYAEQWIKSYKEQNQLRNATSEVMADIYQLKMF